jgi:hypothetical protein
MLVSVAAALIVALPWYVTNWEITLSYVQSATGGALAAGAGPSNPLDPASLTAFSLAFVNNLSLWPVLGIALAGALLLADRTSSWRLGKAVTKQRARRTWGWLLVMAWILLPVGVLVTSHNQDLRYAVFAFPAIAIVFAGLIRMVRWRALRLAVMALVLIAGAAQVAAAGLYRDPGAPGAARVTLAFGSVGALLLFGQAYPPANPAADDGTRVMQELEAAANGRPARVLVAEEDHVFNINTLKWLAELRHDPFTFPFADVMSGDPTELDSYQYAIYVPVSVVNQRNPDNRLSLLNQSTATGVYGDQLFAIFAGGRKAVPIHGGRAWILAR